MLFKWLDKIFVENLALKKFEIRPESFRRCHFRSRNVTFVPLNPNFHRHPSISDSVMRYLFCCQQPDDRIACRSQSANQLQPADICRQVYKAELARISPSDLVRQAWTIGPRALANPNLYNQLSQLSNRSPEVRLHPSSKHSLTWIGLLFTLVIHVRQFHTIFVNRHCGSVMETFNHVCLVCPFILWVEMVILRWNISSTLKPCFQ